MSEEPFNFTSTAEAPDRLQGSRGDHARRTKAARFMDRADGAGEEALQQLMRARQGTSSMATSAPRPAALGERERLTAGGMVLGSVVSVQIGAAVATTLFDELQPEGAVLLRTLFGALVLLALWRPPSAASRGPTGGSSLPSDSPWPS